MAESRLKGDVISVFAADADGCFAGVNRYHLLWRYLCAEYENQITDCIWPAIKKENKSIESNDLNAVKNLTALTKYTNLNNINITLRQMKFNHQKIKLKTRH